MATGYARPPLRVAALGLALLLPACAAYDQARYGGKEDMLAAAGFVQRPANTPERMAAMARLPPHRLLRKVSGDQVIWLYADPTICNCLYVGGQAAYGRYRQNVFERQIADERAVAAQMDETASLNWSWGPWGGYGWW